LGLEKEGKRKIHDLQQITRKKDID